MPVKHMTPKEIIQRSKLQKLSQEMGYDPAMPKSIAEMILSGLIEKKLQEMDTVYSKMVSIAIENVKIFSKTLRSGSDGKPGEKGNDAKPPSDEDILKIIRRIYKQPNDGKTPTKKELLTIITPILNELKIEITPTKSDLEKLVQGIISVQNAAAKKENANTKNINTSESQFKSIHNDITILRQELRRIASDKRSGKPYLHGSGIPSLSAGTGVVLTPDGRGGYIVSATGSGFTGLPATGLVNSSNTVFGFTQKPTYIVIDGIWLKPLADDGVTVQWSWNAGTLQATMTNPPVYSIFGVA